MGWCFATCRCFIISSHYLTRLESDRSRSHGGAALCATSNADASSKADAQINYPRAASDIVYFCAPAQHFVQSEYRFY
jgi:hypothetical protein